MILNNPDIPVPVVVLIAMETNVFYVTTVVTGFIRHVPI